jgi:hypothetical protein
MKKEEGKTKKENVVKRDKIAKFFTRQRIIVVFTSNISAALTSLSVYSIFAFLSGLYFLTL